MELFSPITARFGKSISVNGEYVYKTYEFEPGKGVEVPEEVAQSILRTPGNKEVYFTKEDYIKNFGKAVEPPNEPWESKETFDEVVEETAFTKDDLDALEDSQIFDIAKEMGLKPMPNWKRETLIKKILEVKPIE